MLIIWHSSVIYLNIVFDDIAPLSPLPACLFVQSFCAATHVLLLLLLLLFY